MSGDPSSTTTPQLRWSLDRDIVQARKAIEAADFMAAVRWLTEASATARELAWRKERPTP